MDVPCYIPRVPEASAWELPTEFRAQGLVSVWMCIQMHRTHACVCICIQVDYNCVHVMKVYGGVFSLWSQIEGFHTCSTFVFLIFLLQVLSLCVTCRRLLEGFVSVYNSLSEEISLALCFLLTYLFILNCEVLRLPPAPIFTQVDLIIKRIRGDRGYWWPKDYARHVWLE